MSFDVIKSGHVLMLPSFYSDIDRPLKGIFFREQSEVMAQSGMETGLVFVEPRSLRALSPAGLFRSHLQTSFHIEEGVSVLRQHAWNPGMRTRVGGLVWSHMTERLVRDYIRRRGRPDLIHVQSALWAGEAARRIKLRLSVPYVVTEHSSLLLEPRVAVKLGSNLTRIYSSATAVSAVSESLAAAMSPFCEARQITITPNLLTSAFTDLPETMTKRESFSFICVSNLIPSKGVAVLLEAFGIFSRDHPNVQLLLVGDGPEMSALRRQAAKLGLEGRVKFMGAQPRQSISGLLASADVFVLPSFRETFSVALIEALAVGLPVVATRCGGPTEIVGRIGGTLVAVNDSADLVRGLKTVFHQKPPDRAVLRQRTIEYYGPQSFCRRQLAFYASGLTAALV